MSLLSNILLLVGSEKKLRKYIWHTTGFSPIRIHLYKQAMQHRSRQNVSVKNNERLEYLGDSVLNTIVADYLFFKYPNKDEGFLTEMRSKMVKRTRLNAMAEEIHLQQFLKYEKHNIDISRSDVLGDALEAFIGALYIDHGYARTQKFILNRLVKNLMDIEKMAEENTNYKGILLTKSQRENLVLEYKHTDTKSNGKQNIFFIEVWYNDVLISQAQGFTKKDAEQEAARIAIEKLMM